MMIRRATGISVAAHGAALLALVATALPTPIPPPAFPQKAIAVALAPLPAPKPAAMPAPMPPAPPRPVETVPTQAKPQPKPPAKPQVKPADTRPRPPVVPFKALPAPLTAASLPATDAPPAPAATASPAASAEPAPAAAPPGPVPAQAGAPDASWLSMVRARLESAKRYPAAAARRGQQGVAVIRLQITRDGRILSHSLSRSSGFGALDQEALDLAERVSPLPPMPADMGNRDSVELVVPISFSLR